MDFCQILGKDPDQKDQSTADACGGAARAYAGPAVARELYRLFLFSYWIGNGDLHLKNVALLQPPGGAYALSPAYDLLCTLFYGDDGRMTLSVRGRNKNITRRFWLDFAESDCGVPRDEAEAILDGMLARLPDALAMIQRSPLPNPQFKQQYARHLEKRSRELHR
jgi:serine/threonine-protein kinase HipA